MSTPNDETRLRPAVARLAGALLLAVLSALLYCFS